MLTENQKQMLINLWNGHVETTHSDAEDRWDAALRSAEPGTAQYKKAERKLLEAESAHNEAIACLSAIEQTFGIIGYSVTTNDEDYAVDIADDLA